MTSITASESGLSDLHLEGRPRDTRVVVAMSGGVDSSVAAALLKRAGYDVVGVTLQLYDHGAAVGRAGACCAGRDIGDARRVAARLDIPHYVLDYEQRFRRTVVDTFADAYLAGETPVPCVACNQGVKFADLLQTAEALGARALVTGHYIRSRPGPSGFELHRAVDAERDQSYFLFATTRAQLAFLRFPLGGLRKAETRALAESFGLAVAGKSDSQDICFVPTGRYAQVIERLRPGAAEGGEIVHVDGRVLGRHDGIIHFTVGQRRGLGVTVGAPLYVVRLDAARRQVVVGPREALLVRRLRLRDLNWLGDRGFEATPEIGLDLYAKIRSTQAPRPATLFNRDGVAVVELHDGEHGVSPGQACVFYDGARVLGGGWIEATAQDDLERRLPEPGARGRGAAVAA